MMGLHARQDMPCLYVGLLHMRVIHDSSTLDTHTYTYLQEAARDSTAQPAATTSQQWSCATPINSPATLKQPQPSSASPPAAVAPDLPTTYRRLCARRTGASVRDVAEIEEVPLIMPGPGEVCVRGK